MIKMTNDKIKDIVSLCNHMKVEIDNDVYFVLDIHNEMMKTQYYDFWFIKDWV